MSPTNKINELSQDQINQLINYRDKWLSIGLDTKPGNKEKAKQAVVDAYKESGLVAPKIFIWLRSPLEGVFGSYFLTKIQDLANTQVVDQVMDQVMDQVGNQVKSQVLDKVWSQVRDKVWNQVWYNVDSQVWDQVVSQVRSQVMDQVWDQVRNQVWYKVEYHVKDQVGSQVMDQVVSQVKNQVGSQVRDQVGSQIMDQVWDQVMDKVWAQVCDKARNQVWYKVESQVRDQAVSQVMDQVGKCGFGLHDANWLSFYEYFKNVVMLDCTKRLDPLMRLAEHCGWWWPFENAVILTEKPIFISMKNGRLHCDGRKAIEYSDGFGLWKLNGVTVPEYLAKTPGSELDIEFLKKEKNSEVRAQFVRKYGIERMRSMGKVLEQDSVYKLIDMSPIFQNRSFAPYLEMVNPSTGTTHVEGVHPDCKTIQEAIEWRNQCEGKPKILT